MSLVAKRKADVINNGLNQKALTQEEGAYKFGGIVAELRVGGTEAKAFLTDNIELFRKAMDSETSFINGITESLEDMGYYHGTEDYWDIYGKIMGDVTNVLEAKIIGN